MKLKSPFVIILLFLVIVGLFFISPFGRRLLNRFGGHRPPGQIEPTPRPKPSGATTTPSPVPPGVSLCTSGKNVSCASLGASWSGGTTTCRSDGSGFDVSSCTKASLGGKSEMVKPALRDEGRWLTARCNDGSPFGYDVRLSLSGSPEWVLYLEGGAFCEDNAKSCLERGEKLSSTPPEADRSTTQIKPAGIFSPDRSKNPTFYDANLVFARYCSSDGWSGSTTERRSTVANSQGWYFSGRVNVRAMFESLAQRYGLNESDSKTKILFAGSSAGGQGIEVNADIAATVFPNAAKNGRLLLVNDGGFIPGFDDPKYRPGDSSDPVSGIVARAYSFWGSKLNPICEADNRTNRGRCFLGQVIYPYVTRFSPRGLGLPLFIQYSTIDRFALELHGIEKNDAEVLSKWRSTILKELEGIEWLFSGGQISYHTILTADGSRGFHMGPSGKTFQEMLTRFWKGDNPQRVVF